MPETINPLGEQEPKHLWKELITIDKLINDKLKKIDASGSDFLGREEILDQLRKKYNWYEKWASSTLLDRTDWAKEHPDNKYKKNTEEFAAIAEKNYQLALSVYNEGEVSMTLNQIENDTLESSVKELKEIKNLVNTVDEKEIARKFLTWILNFKKQVTYRDLTEEELTYFNEYSEVIESNIDDRDVSFQFLPLFIDKLIEIIKSKKKGNRKV